MSHRGRGCRAVFALGALAAVLAGCYGSTQPATNVGLVRATLNGRGTTDHGTAHVFFQYWPTTEPQHVSVTAGRDIPGGATGPYSEATPTYPAPVDGALAYATEYSFRLCGKDQSSTQGAACAQTQTFTTGHPAGDVVRGSFSERIGGDVGQVDAHSGPSGGSPGGTMSLPSGGDPSAGSDFKGTVSCLEVKGARGAVGAVGTQGGHPATALFAVEATGTSGQATIDFSITSGATPPDCASADFGHLFTPLGPVALRVYDAP